MGFGRLQVDRELAHGSFLARACIDVVEQGATAGHMSELSGILLNAFYLAKIQEIGPCLHMPSNWKFVEAGWKGTTIQMVLDFNGERFEVDVCLAIRMKGLLQCQVADSARGVCSEHLLLPSAILRMDLGGV